MDRPAVTRRLVLWGGFVACSAVTMGLDGVLPNYYLSAGSLQIGIYDLLLVAALVLGAAEVFAAFTRQESRLTVTMMRLIVAYLTFELLVVTPVAMSLGYSPSAVLRTITVRFTWLIAPTIWAISQDDRSRSIAGTLPIVAAVCLGVWGLYSAATGGAGFYYDNGDIRFRVLWGGSVLLFAWPLLVATSGAVSRRLAIPLAGLGLIGLALTNHRSAFIAIGLAVVLSVAASGAWRRALGWVIPAALIALIAALLAAPRLQQMFGYTFDSLFDFASGNGADRLMRWKLAWDMFKSRPVNDWVWTWTWYRVTLRDPYGPHNFFLEIAVSEGLAGLAFYGVLLWTTLRAGWHWLRHDSVIRVLVSYIVAYLGFSALNTTIYSVATAPLFAAAVAAVAVRVDQLRSLESGLAKPVRADDTGGIA